MIAYGAVLRLNLLFGRWLYANTFTNSCIRVIHTFTIIGHIAEYTLKLINDVRSKILHCIKNEVFH